MLNWAWQSKARQSWSKSKGKSSWREKYTQWLANWLCSLAVICMFSSIVCIFQSHKQNTHSRSYVLTHTDTQSVWHCHILFIYSFGSYTVGISILQPISFHLTMSTDAQVIRVLNKAHGTFNTYVRTFCIVRICMNVYL